MSGLSRLLVFFLKSLPVFPTDPIFIDSAPQLPEALSHLISEFYLHLFSILHFVSFWGLSNNK